MPLTRTRVLAEIEQLSRQVNALKTTDAPVSCASPEDVVAELSDLEKEILLARRLVSSNEMDFRKIDLLLRQVRSRISRLRDRFGNDSAKN